MPHAWTVSAQRRREGGGIVQGAQERQELIDLACSGLHQRQVRAWFTNSLNFYSSPSIKLFVCVWVGEVESTCPRGYSGSSVSSLPDRELDYPAAQESSPAKTRHGLRENRCRFSHVHLRACVDFYCKDKQDSLIY